MMAGGARRRDRVLELRVPTRPRPAAAPSGEELPVGEDNTGPRHRLMGTTVPTTKVRAPGALTRSASLGRIEVAPQVVASIAGHAANECYGIVAMAARGLRDGIGERLQRENLHRGVDVKVEDDGIRIQLWVVVEYGVRITEVAHSLQNAVRYQVEKALGIPVNTVDVN